MSAKEGEEAASGSKGEAGSPARRRPKKRVAVGRRNVAGRRGGSLAQIEAELEGLGEAEKRRRLLELLRSDICGDEDERKDEEWVMPELDADGRTAAAGSAMCFDFSACEVEMGAEAVEQLIKACRLVFALDGSSWLPCGAKPRCLAERLASAVFERHAAGATFDASRSGAEWWAQVRQPGHAEEAIQFHWDTDENAVEQRGVNVHPHLSTVTYLADSGAPTLVLDRRNPPRPGDVSQIYGPIRQGLLSQPRVGKHIVFDGQLLHGTAPLASAASGAAAGADAGARGERVTFLVNVWLNHRPSHCRPVPDDLARRLGDAALPISLAAPAAPLPTVEVAGGGSDEEKSGSKLEAAFGRTKPHAHRLRALLPAVPPGGTALLSFADGAAELGEALAA